MPSLVSLKTDLVAEVKGVWIPVFGGLRLLIGRMGSVTYKREARRLSQPHLRRLRNGDTELMEDINRQVMAATVLLGWENLQDEETGENVPFSKKAALELLTKYPEFLEMVQEYASSFNTFAVKEKQDAEENS